MPSACVKHAHPGSTELSLQKELSMTASIYPHVVSSLAVQAPDSIAYMSNSQGYDWHNQQNRYPQSSYPNSGSNYADSDAPPFGRVHDLDLRLFQQPAQSNYNPYANSNSNQLLSPDMSYGAPEPNWPPDIEAGTPSTAHSGFGHEPMDVFSTKQSPLMSNSQTSHKARSTPGSMAGSQPWTSATQSQHHNSVASERPSLHRAHTGPESQSRRGAAPATASPQIKSSESMESDEELAQNGAVAPAADTKGVRGRKRQRIPHTAVERRYRENLNAHLDKLRQAVPALASRRSDGSSRVDGAAAEGVKPSKCEILSGAIEHIGALDRENEALKADVQALRTRIQELESWYRGGLRAGPYP